MKLNAITRLSVAGVCLFIWLASTSQAGAELIAYEPFDGTSGSGLSTLTNHAGLGTWSDSSAQLSSVSLTYPGVTNSGIGCLNFNARSVSSSSVSLDKPQGAGGTHAWVGLLARNNGGNTFRLTVGAYLSMTGTSGTTWTLDCPGGGSTLTSSVSVTNTTFMVYHFTFSDTDLSDTVDWYVNPDATKENLLVTDPSYVGSITNNFEITGITFQTRASASVDEIRITDNFFETTGRVLPKALSSP